MLCRGLAEGLLQEPSFLEQLGGGGGGEERNEHFRIGTTTRVSLFRKLVVVHSAQCSKGLGQGPRPGRSACLDAFQPLKNGNTLAPYSRNGVLTRVILGPR